MKDKTLYINNDHLSLEEFLKSSHPDILKAIEKEGYNLDFMEFDAFWAIEDDNQIVGFITLKRFQLTVNHFAIMEAYVLPEYRGKDLFYDNFLIMLTFDNYEYYPRRPTKAFINVLLKNDLAFKIAPNFVVSYFKFIVDIDEDIYKNPKIKRFYKNPKTIVPYKANLFDMDLCSVMFRDPALELVKYSDLFAMTEPRKYDLKKYKCRKKLKKVGEKYIDERFETWESRYDKIEDFIQRKDEDFENLFSIEKTLGTEDELEESFIKELEASNLSIEEGLRIRNHVIEKIDSGELSKRSYMQRVSYLLDNFQDIDKKIGKYDEDIEECPFCKSELPDYLRSCPNCGLHIRDIDFEENAVNKLNESMHNLFEEIQDKGYNPDSEDDMRNLFNKLSDDLFKPPAPITDQDDDEMIELKIFFNEHMRDYDFNEFLPYYNEYKGDKDIEEIKNIFIEENLKKSLGTRNEYKSYLSYIIHHFYFEEDMGRYDEAFIKMIQMAILASNKAKNKKHILESSQNSPDVLFAVEDMESVKDKHSFDLPKLFDKAVESFRIEKYNKNHDEVLKELSKIFD